MLPCLNAGLDLYISTSRVFYVTLMARSVTDPQSCVLPAGDIVDVVLSPYQGIDSKELLIAAAAARGMTVVLGSPGFPMQLTVVRSLLAPRPS